MCFFVVIKGTCIHITLRLGLLHSTNVTVTESMVAYVLMRKPFHCNFLWDQLSSVKLFPDRERVLKTACPLQCHRIKKCSCRNEVTALVIIMCHSYASVCLSDFSKDPPLEMHNKPISTSTSCTLQCFFYGTCQLEADTSPYEIKQEYYKLFNSSGY